MRCPKHIKDALRKRAECAENFTVYDVRIGEFLKKHGVEVEDYDIYGGCEAYVNPWESSKRIYDAILQKADGGKNDD